MTDNEEKPDHLLIKIEDLVYNHDETEIEGNAEGLSLVPLPEEEITPYRGIEAGTISDVTKYLRDKNEKAARGLSTGNLELEPLEDETKALGENEKFY